MSEGEQHNHKPLIPPQITRILLLVVIIIVSYSIAHHFLVPASFGQYGWFRGKAIQEIASLPITFAGRKACLECHSDVADKMAKSSHKGLSCESCHYACEAHANDPTASSPEPLKNPRFCVSCHEANPSRPAKFPQVDVADHAGKQGCTECHIPHIPTESPSK